MSSLKRAFWSVAAAIVLIAVSAIVQETGISPAAAQEDQTVNDTSASVLFVVNGRRASASKDGDMYTLVMRGVPRNALGFEDRPGDSARPIRITRMLDSFFAKEPVVPPNAAFDARTGGRKVVIPVKIHAGSYQDRRLTVTVTILKGAPDAALAGRFTDPSLFIDDGAAAHTCRVNLNFFTTETWTLDTATKWGTDDWDTSPYTSAFQADPHTSFSYWESSGGSYRGCGNTVQYVNGAANVEITVAVTDPWSGPNTYSCSVYSPYSSNYRCTGPVSGCTGDGDCSDHLGGNDLSVVYTVCYDQSDDPDTMCE